MKKALKIIPMIPVAIILAMFTMISVYAINDRKIDYDVSTEGIDIPKFQEVEIDFIQEHNAAKSLPFAAGAIIDIDNDGTEELFLGGGYNQQDALFRFKESTFSAITSQTSLTKNSNDATLGSTVIDVDHNGFSDLLIVRESGVWLYKNSNGQFTGEKLNLPLRDDTTPLSVAVADINRDGHFDMYVSGYIRLDLVEGQNIFNKEGYGGTSAMLLNNGDDSFTDITESSGLYYKHNTFQGVFADFDNDGLEDLVVAHDTGQIRTWKNIGNNQFINMPNPNSEQNSYPMGIAVGDYNNDGLIDLFFSNVGSTAPNFLVLGDLREDQVFNPKWIMFENRGDFKFEDVADKTRLADYEFAWGAIFEDFNLDGREDLVVSENYIDCPPHKVPFLRLPGRFMLQNQHGEFAEMGEQAGVENMFYGISPLSADFNHDGYPDLVHVNLAAKPKAFISKGGNSHYVKVKLPDTVESIGAMVTVTTDDGKTLKRPFISGEGLCSDQSHILSFGLNNQKAMKIDVHYLNGNNESQSGSFDNTMVRF